MIEIHLTDNVETATLKYKSTPGYYKVGDKKVISHTITDTLIKAQMEKNGYLSDYQNINILKQYAHAIIDEKNTTKHKRKLDLIDPKSNLQQFIKQLNEYDRYITNGIKKNPLIIYNSDSAFDTIMGQIEIYSCEIESTTQEEIKENYVQVFAAEKDGNYYDLKHKTKDFDTYYQIIDFADRLMFSEYANSILQEIYVDKSDYLLLDKNSANYQQQLNNLLGNSKFKNNYDIRGSLLQTEYREFEKNYKKAKAQKAEKSLIRRIFRF